MLAVILLACVLLAGVQSAPSKRGLFGICVEMCRQTNPSSCPAGQTCMSNGCGHTCQPSGSTHIKPHCPGVMCEMWCPSGFVTGKDGCPTCSCNSNILPVFS